MKKLIYIIIASALALAACEKTLDFPFEYKQPKLVLIDPLAQRYKDTNQEQQEYSSIRPLQ